MNGKERYYLRGRRANDGKWEIEREDHEQGKKDSNGVKSYMRASSIALISFSLWCL
jgi:hypothetical protein